MIQIITVSRERLKDGWVTIATREELSAKWGVGFLYLGDPCYIFAGTYLESSVYPLNNLMLSPHSLYHKGTTDYMYFATVWDGDHTFHILEALQKREVTEFSECIV